MTVDLYPRAPARFARRLYVCGLLLALLNAGAHGRAQGPPAPQLPPASPVLLTEGTGATTRGVAYEAVTFRSEPFPVVSPVNWNADKTNTRDQQTRVMLFAMNLDLLPGECGRDAAPNCSMGLTADAQDAAGRVYPLRVEAVTRPAYDSFDSVNKRHVEVPQDWLYAVTLRLDESMTDALGDVLVRINLHGLSSNRVRIAIGQAGAGPAADPATEFVSPAPAATPQPTPQPTPQAYGPGEASDADVTRLLEQATWGPTPAEVARVRQMGIRAFLDEQFGAPAVNYVDLPFPNNDTNQQCPSSLGAALQGDCIRDNYSMYPLQKNFFSNAMYGQSQLRHRVGFALHQILVVSGRDVNRPSWMTVYLQSLDRHAFGNFRSLLREVTLTPAMGDYLDMNRSTRVNPNENFAREVMQLFAVGVNEMNLDATLKLDAQGRPIPVYTQTTVDELTRALTGWNFNPIPLGTNITNWRDPMTPRENNHDTGAKTLLSYPGAPGAVLPAGQTATQDLDAALNNLFNHPNVGPFISKQLIQHLVTSNPSPAYVARASRAFNDDCDALYKDGCTGARGNLRAVVRAILLDPEARGDLKTDPAYGRLREPVQLMGNVLRAFDAKSFSRTGQSDGVLSGRASGGDYTTLMDQPLFLPPTVFSYYPADYEVPGTRLLGPAFNILSTATSLRRANFVNQLVYTGYPPTTGTNTNTPAGTALDLSPLETVAADTAQLVDRLDALLMHGTMSAPMRSSILGALASVPTSDANFARKRARMAVYLVATSSQYQVQR